MVDTTQILKEVDAEIARLTKLRAALIEASGKSASKKSRISPSGSMVIALAAKLRHARRSGDKVRIKDLERKLAARLRNQRPRRNAAPLPMAAAVALETSGPKPGIWRSRRQRSSSVPMRSI